MSGIDLRNGTTRTFVFLFWLAALFVVGTPGSARADGLTLNNGGSDVMGGVYVGPYNFTDTTTGQTLQLDCDDFSDEVYPGESWSAVTSTIPSLSNVQFTGAQELQNYDEAAYLTQMIFANLSNSTTVGELQWAVWDIFDPGASSSDPYGSLTSQELTAINGYVSLAQTNYASGNYSDVTVYTPVPGSQVPYVDGPPQEYLTVSTPEPSSIALLGVGLIGLLFLARRKRFVLPA